MRTGRSCIALLNTAAGATWATYDGGGVGIGNSIHAGMVVVADGSEAAGSGSNGFTTDPGTGADRRGDREAIDLARRTALDLPSIE